MHIPVMCQEVIDYLRPQSNAIFVDGTLGMGGHAKAILEKIGPRGRLIGLDKDEQALQQARERLKEEAKRCDLIYGDFRDLDKILRRLGVTCVDGIFLDLGISSFQMDSPWRGFSLREEGPLDMRMDANNPIRAFDLVNGLSEKEIDLILKEYGEERWHHAIARALVKARTRHPIETTRELARIIVEAIPRRRMKGRYYQEKIHPATRSFQAFRIAVNRELESLEMVLQNSLGLLKKGGRMGVIAFHSLEDRRVKQAFRRWVSAQRACFVIKKPLRPTSDEIAQNPRARSARLRVIERI